MSESKPERPASPPRQFARHVMPLGMRVLVRLIPSEDRSASGLFLPPGAKDATARAGYGQVVEVARASPKPGDESFDANVSGVPQDAFVLFPKDSGVPVPWDENLRVVDVKDILAIVDEHALDEAH
jgi:co-chaperonin GroES (HSP10)